MVVMASGTVTRLNADQVPSQGRRTQGWPLVQPATGDRVVEVTRAYSETGVDKAAGEDSPLVEGGSPPDEEQPAAAGQLDLLG